MQANAMMRGNATMQGNARWHGCPLMLGGGRTWMTVGMGIVWLLTIALLVLGIAALVKYPRSGPPRA